MEAILSYANGSTFLEINKANFRKIKISISDWQLQKKFNSICESIFDKIYQNQKETNNLIEIRDSLLPKLMSGKIRVKVSELEIKVSESEFAKF
jgi:type I restriction enzyme S subunit